MLRNTWVLAVALCGACAPVSIGRTLEATPPDPAPAADATDSVVDYVDETPEDEVVVAENGRACSPETDATTDSEVDVSHDATDDELAEPSRELVHALFTPAQRRSLARCATAAIRGIRGESDHVVALEEIAEYPEMGHLLNIRVLRRGALVGVNTYSSDGGSMGSWHESTDIFDVQTCRRVGSASRSGAHGFYVLPIWNSGALRDPSSAAYRLAAETQGHDSADFSDPSAAVARRFLESIASRSRIDEEIGSEEQSGSDDAASEPPAEPFSVMRISTALAPVPLRGLSIKPHLITARSLPAGLGDRIAQSGPNETEDACLTPSSSVWIGGVEMPTVSTVDGVRIWEARLRGKNQGVVVGLIERGNTVRLVLETRYAVLGTWIRWLGVRSGLLFGHYESNARSIDYRGAGSIFAIRMADGSVFGLNVAGAFENGSIANYEHREELLSRCEDATRPAERQRRCSSPGRPNFAGPETAGVIFAHYPVLAGDVLRVWQREQEWMEIPVRELATRIQAQDD